jgi:hypothetical protein
MSPLEQLLSAWRTQAESLRNFGAPGQAEAVTRCADELAAAITGTADELLTLTRAARECGYSPDHLGRLIRRGRLRNYGREHAPRVRRDDLPRKPEVALRRGDAADLAVLTRTAIATTRRKA